jgi:NAD(P)-dependent dehydrogenase (short-subunit alcohol dehydrogenase family)
MNDPLFSVAGQVVLVSGGSRGIGRALAEAFARRGARVVIAGRDPARLEETARALGPDARALPCDVTRAEDRRRLVERVLSEFGRVDTLLNVAGVNRRGRAERFTEEDYDFILDTNLKGAFFLSLEVGRAMLERRRGCQIHVASLTSRRPLRGVAPYAMSKAGLAQMTRALALEWGPRGVRVNALAPGFIRTDLTRPLWERPEMRAWAEAHTPLGRLGEPDDLAGAALFLASDAARFVTGHVLYVDGGFSSGFPWPLPLDPGS